MSDNEALEILNGLVERNALVTDVRKGGLVLGVSHDEGGIPVLNVVCVNGVEMLLPLSVMEGGEYILNQKSTEAYVETLKFFNEFSEPIEQEEYSIKKGYEYTVYKINKGDAVIVDGEHMIINKRATLKYLHQLELLNGLYSKEIEAVPPFRYRDILEKFYGKNNI